MSLIPYICCRDASSAIGFYEKALGAKELFRLAEPDGRLGHAELAIGSAILFLSDEFPDFGCAAPVAGTPSNVSLHLDVPDVDATVERASREGAKVVRPPKDEFYGHRSATIIDPYGHRWMISTRKEELSNEEIRERHKKLTA